MRVPGRTQFTLEFNWKITLVTVLFLPVLIGLGFWQLDRAEEKRQIIGAFEQRLNLPPVDVDTQDDAYALQSHQAVTLTGSFNQQQWFLLDNRVRRGQAGFEVLVPFYTSEGKWIIVNRGWVKANALRTDLPEVEFPAGEVTIRGRLRLVQGDLVLSDDVAEGDGWPRIVQTERVLILNRLLEDFDHTLWRFSVRIDADDPAALEAGWPLINTSPAKHIGYAVQWFALAAALLVLLVFANTNLWAVLSSRGGKTTADQA
ncbi:SURF1 family protein [Exilibacterium tricleocarpae]|uniref:SURF1-like protein n=1 Tax=Exilibacterium tricleocarpae TaxID=2591008 RepID=A0A545T0G3_9GAMM|nr:SURF1 family protein [Exilibacterium tricleocarpae]TQV70714.1 SURF1 family protein [Exilibacterium tricleocarpae]